MKRYLLLLGLVCACGGGGGGGDDTPAPDAAPSIDADPRCATEEPIVLFVNGGGGTYTPGPDDPGTNTSLIVAEPTTIAPFALGDVAWGEVMACVSDLFAPYHVTVTDVDPGAVPHVEVAVTGDASTSVINQSGVYSIAPSLTCDGAVEPAVAFVFSAEIGTAVADHCWQIGWVTGITFDLDTTLRCEDVMTFQGNCGAKTFLDQDSQCGEFEARQCRCDPSPTQNSHQRLLEIVGPACD